MADYLRPHGLQHARLPCPSSSTGAFSNPCPSSRWCHPTISSSVVPFSCPPVVIYGSESWTIKKTKHRRIDAFKLWSWRRLLRVPWTAKSSQSILKEINPEYSLEGLMLKLKLQYLGHLMWRTDSLEKYLDAGKDWRQEETGTTEDEMVGWYHRLDGHEFEQALGIGDGQGSLGCCSPLGRK